MASWHLLQLLEGQCSLSRVLKAKESLRKSLYLQQSGDKNIIHPATEYLGLTAEKVDLQIAFSICISLLTCGKIFSSLKKKSIITTPLCQASHNYSTDNKEDMPFKFCGLTRRIWCSWAISALTLSFRETVSRNWPHRAISREHNCARFILTISASSSGLSAFCCNITHMKIYIYIYIKVRQRWATPDNV